MMMLLVLTTVLGYELKAAVGTSVFVMAFTGAVSHFAIGGMPDMWYMTVCVLSTLLWARLEMFCYTTSGERKRNIWKK